MVEQARVPENLGRKMAFGVYSIRDIAVFSFWLIFFGAIGIATGFLWIGLFGLPIGYLAGFQKIDGIPFFSYLKLKFRNVYPSLGTLKMYMGDTLFNGRRYFMVLEVGGVNYSFMSEDDRIGILLNYERLLNAIDFPFQIVVHTEPYEYEPFLDLVRVKNKAADGYKKLIKEACEGLYFQRYFLIIGADYYEIQGDVKNEGVRAKIARELLLKRLNIVAEGLTSMGIPFEVVRGKAIIDLLKRELS